MRRRAVLGLLDRRELRVEVQQHLIRHAEEHELSGKLAVHLEADDAFIEGAHRVERINACCSAWLEGEHAAPSVLEESIGDRAVGV